MSDETPKKTLVAKLAEVMAEIDHVEKAGRHATKNYNYLRATDVARAVRLGLAKRNIIMLGKILSAQRYEIPARDYSLPAVDIHILYTFYDGDTGETLEAHGYGSGAGEDKASYKAQTGALKSVLRYTFLIPDESDPEADASVDAAIEGRAPLPTNQPPKLAVPRSSLKDQVRAAGHEVAPAKKELPIGEGVITFTEAKTGKGKGGKPGRQYFSVTQNGVKMACWESKQPHILRAELWSHLSDAQGKYAKLIVLSEPDKADPSKTWHNIVGILRAGDKEWLEDGTPVIQRNAPDDPFGKSLLEPGSDSDEETGLPI